MTDDFENTNDPSFNRDRGHFQDRSRIGLLPTDGQNVYKKSTARSSRRSRAERTSYLMATGHLDPEETQELNSPGDNSEYVSDVLNRPSEAKRNDEQTNAFRNNIFRPKPSVSARLSELDRALIQELNGRNDMRVNQLHELQNKEIFNVPRQKKGSKRNSNNKLSPYNDQLGSRTGTTYTFNESEEDITQNRGGFRQTTYTEVSLPMKTSPALEFFLKENQRRNKRCCMWLLYSTIVTVCLAIILFCGVHLMIRFGDSL